MICFFSITMSEPKFYLETKPRHKNKSVLIQAFDNKTGEEIGRLSAAINTSLGSIYVNGNYRRIGVGKGLIDEYVNFVKQKTPYQKIEFVCLHSNVEAQKFYEKLGFKIDPKNEQYVSVTYNF